MSTEPSPRWGHFSAVVGGQLYVWGGKTKNFFEEKNVLASVFHSFHPVLESWERHECDSPPPALYRGACASTRGNLYLYGGTDGSDYQGCLYQLDIKSRKWQQLSSGGPMRKAGCGMIVYGKKLVLFGGCGIPSGPIQHGAQFVKNTSHTDGRGWTNELHIFDLEEKTWSSPQDSGTRPPPCCNFSLTMIDDHRVALFGGLYPGSKRSNDVYILDLRRMHWSKMKHFLGEPRPMGRSLHAAVCLGYGENNPQLLVIGGFDGLKLFKELWLLDLDSGHWKKVTVPTLQQGCYHSATSINLGPGLVEVILFGGNMTNLFVVLTANTTVLRFECDPLSGKRAREWVLTDMADITQLGTNKRVMAKREKISEYSQSIVEQLPKSQSDEEDSSCMPLLESQSDVANSSGIPSLECQSDGSYEKIKPSHRLDVNKLELASPESASTLHSTQQTGHSTGKVSKSDVTLSLQFLKLFKWKNECGAKQQLRIIETIGVKWREVAALLGLSMSQMDGIQQQSCMDPEQCCMRVFDCWIVSNGELTNYPITWSDLHELLEDIGHRAIAEHMKTALRTVGIDIPTPNSEKKSTASGLSSLPEERGNSTDIPLGSTINLSRKRKRERTSSPTCCPDSKRSTPH